MRKDFIINIHHVSPLSLSQNPIVIVDDDFAQLENIKYCYTKSERQNELLFFNKSQDLIEYLYVVGIDHLPSLIMLDINMPELDGFETLKILKKMSSPICNIPIIMFSASDNEEDQHNSFLRGANAYLAKPLEISSYINFFKNI